MTLPDVSIGQPHSKAHNDERHLANSVAAEIAISYRWSIEIDPFMPPAVQTNWNSIFIDNSALQRAYIQATTQSSLIGWDVVFGAGTWKFSLMFLKSINYAIYTVQLDGVTVGTIDGYNGSLLYNQIGSVSGVVIATSGKKRLTLTNATKNASSSGYYAQLQAVSLRRTA